MNPIEGAHHQRSTPGPWWLAKSREEVPSDLDWLSSEEHRHLARLRIEKRRHDWLLGRWTAKSALLQSPYFLGSGTAPEDLTVWQAADGAPEALFRGRALPLTLSISHRSGRGLCVLAPKALLVGCDLETVEARSPAFLQDYFTPDEQTALRVAPANDRDRVATLFWGAKESALKALRLGLRADTRRIGVELPARSGEDHTWRSLVVRDTESDRGFGGWFRMLEGLALVVVTSPRSEAPVSLAANP
jgi:4'-phosphopantetheinyl transferase